MCANRISTFLAFAARLLEGFRIVSFGLQYFWMPMRGPIPMLIDTYITACPGGDCSYKSGLGFPPAEAVLL